MKARSQRVFSDTHGDTIVEVLIAIGIISLVLTSAYALTNRNAQSAQKTQEQGQAQKLVERQIELMRSYDGAINSGCLVTVGTGIAVGSGATCQVTAESSSAKYTLSISDKGSSRYAISAKWDALGGQNGNVTMYYQR